METVSSMEPLVQVAGSLIRFSFATITSHFIGEQLANSRIRLPHLTGYLLGGFISGPFGIGLVTAESLSRLGFLNAVALAAIAFCAGTELYLPDIKPHLRAIVGQMSFICVATMLWCAGIVMVIRPWVPYINSVDLPCQWQMALLCGSIMIARSPSSALALIQSLFAKGELTALCMGITVVSDAVLLVVFAVTNSLATAECLGFGIDIWAFIDLAISVFGSILVGYILSKFIVVAMWIPIFASRFKGAIIMAAGFGVFIGSRHMEKLSKSRYNHAFKVEPLLVCIVASCFACHASSKRRMLSMILRKSSILVFLPFFTLTGASFDIQNVMPVLPLSIALFTARMIAIWFGSWSGLKFIQSRHLRARCTYLWMTLTTQAGAAIGLANEVSHSFNPWGASFADAVTLVVIYNQICGPFIFRLALRRVGEDRSPKQWQDRDVAVLGINHTAMSVCSRLCLSGCRIRVIRPHGVSLEYAQNQLDEVSQSLNPANEANCFQLRLMPDCLPSSEDCAIGPLDGPRHKVDIDYCPPTVTIAPLDPLLDEDECNHPLMESGCTVDYPKLAALVLRLIPVECATVVVSLGDDCATIDTCRIITTVCPHVIPRIVAVVSSESCAATLCKLGIIVVHPHAALADVTSALALTHSSEAVSILMPGKFSVRAAKNQIRCNDYTKDERLKPGGFAVPSPKISANDYPSSSDSASVRRGSNWSMDDWSVPMTTRGYNFPAPEMMGNDWTWLRQELIKRRREAQRITERRPLSSQWMSLG